MIIVTGASEGIGRAIIERLIKQGENVFGISRHTENLPFRSMSGDVSSYNDLKEISNIFKKEKFRVKGIINAAGVASMNLALLTPPEITNKIISVNLLGTIYTSQIFSPYLIRERKGTIINFSTIAVPLGLKGESVYIASKAGVEGFSRSFAREMADFNVNVHCISPGPIDTNLINGVSRSQIDKIISRQILPKQFSKESIVDLVELLLDERSKSLSGQVFHVGGV